MTVNARLWFYTILLLRLVLSIFIFFLQACILKECSVIAKYVFEFLVSLTKKTVQECIYIQNCDIE